MRRCAICSASLEGRRRGAVCCGPACRRELCRVRQLSRGEQVHGYETLGQYLDRRKKRAKAGQR